MTGPTSVPDARKWNHNLHYSHLLLAHARPCSGRVLDVGCGEGVLTRALGRQSAQVVGLDLDARSLRLAREQTTDSNVHYVRGDVLAAPFPPGSFDAVVSVATLHHVPAQAGLLAMAELVRPGGRLAVLGLARSRLPRDLGRELAAAVSTRALRLRHREWQHSAPTVWPPPTTYDEVRRLAAATLPGSSYRRLVLWRYLVTWEKPGV